MKVVTLDENVLEEHVERLAAAVAEAVPQGGFDALIGVKRGGAIVCDAFCRHFPKSDYGFRTDVFLQRRSTRKKSALVGALLKKLPYWLLDLMRMGESRILELQNRGKNSKCGQKFAQTVELPENLYQMLRAKEAPEVLIIDDAIDSGNTLAAVSGALRKENPHVATTVAVITETTPTSRMRADFTIYHDRTLIRFPWSNDYKEKSRSRHTPT